MIMILWSLSTFFSTSSTNFSNASSRPLWPLESLYRALTDADLKSLCLMYLILSRSSLEIMGFWILSFFACLAFISKILKSLPMDNLYQ